MYSTTQNSRQGAPHVVMMMDDYKFATRKYVNKIRPQQDPSGLQEELFLLPGAKPVYNPAALMQRLGQQYGINVEMPTNLRKMGATVVIALRPDETMIVQRHMSHTPATAARYYQAVSGKKKAAKAHMLQKKLEATKSREESEVHEDCEELMKIEE